MALPSGTRLGPYEVVAPLGAGGMGEVYRARDTRLDRLVALKVLPAHVSGDPDRRGRFEREARAIARLQHPHICTIHDVGAQDGVDYLVMELLEGETLADRLDRGPLPLDQVIRYGREMAEALDRAHKAGIVHRDLKPANVMITRSGVKLLDFGLARLSGAGLSEDGTLTAHRVGDKPLTDAGSIVGTLAYMPPEQLEGREADARSDVWALGAVLYEMATGRQPFVGKSQASLIGSILRDEPAPITSLQPLSPPALDRLVRSCLTKDPDQRWQSAHDVGTALAWVQDQASRPSASPSTVRRRGRSWATWAAAFAVLAAAAVLARRAPVESEGDPPRFQRLTFRRGNILRARFSADGTMVVYSASWEGRPAEVFVSHAGSVDGRPLGLGPADVAAVSAQGELAIIKRGSLLTGGNTLGTLARVPLGGGAPRDLLEDVRAADWSPDGKDLAVVRRVQGRMRLEYPVGRVLMEHDGLQEPRVSPDGRSVGIVQSRQTGADRLLILDRGGKVEVSADVPRLGVFVAWHPGGELLFVGGGAATDFAVRSLGRSGAQRVLYRSPASVTLYDVSRDGRVLLESAEFQQGILFGSTTASAERELSWHGTSAFPHLSRDGASVLFSEVGDGEDPGYSVYLRPTDGGSAVRLGTGEAQGLSEDGRWALTRTLDDPPRLILLPVGAGEPQVVDTGPLKPLAAHFLPGGRLLVAAEQPDGKARLHVGPLKGPFPAQPLSDVPIARPLVPSPDGRWLAGAGADGELTLLSLDGGDSRAVKGVLPGESVIAWRSGGRSLLVARREIPRHVWAVDLETGERRSWRVLMPAEPTGVAIIGAVRVAADEKSYAYEYSRVLSSYLFVAEGIR